MAKTVADLLVERLIDWGVDTIFGFPGDGINGIFESLRTRQKQIKFIQVRHEEAAAFAACGYAKYTGRLGVCLATSGPGGVHLLNGLYDAKSDGQPVLAITGHTFHDLINTHGQQDVDLEKLFMDVAVYSERIMGPAHVHNVVDSAIKHAFARRSVAHFCIPKDIQEWTAADVPRSPANIAHHSADLFTAASPLPGSAVLTQAADLINAGKKVAILAGRGCLSARQEVLELAEKVGGPIIKPLLGKGVVPDNSPYTTGGIGLLGTAPSQDAMQACDTLIIVGTSFPYMEFYPQPGKAKCVQIDIDETRIGLRYPADIGLIGDCRRVLAALLPLVQKKEDRGFLTQAQEGMQHGGETALPTTYTPAATTNLFYMNNIMHDIWYNYGFDEVNGNYQQSNLGRGGITSATGDYVQADSQDGYSQTTATLNNANFTPTNDGVRPRIQMFLWTLGAPPTNYITINSPASIAGGYAATTNVFEGTDAIPVPVSPNGITSDLVLYENAPNPNTDVISIHNACVPPTNAFDVAGKIVLIRRGNCNFSNKVKNAQDAGALAAIVYDTVPNNPVRLSMSSTGILGITIPAVFVTKEIGEQFIAEMANGPVNAKLEVPANLYLYADGDFDNVIIGHEYGHGISNRLVGGGQAGCMTNYDQMGEGWSDWFGLMNQIKTGDTGVDAKEVGTYVINQPTTGFGIRDFPYSTDMTVNPRTLVDSNLPIPVDPTDTAYRYKIGEFWTSCLWDLTWAYINKYGYDPDIYNGTGGNNKVMRLVADALKLETCNATNIVSGRDNLFAAEQLTTGGADYCMIADVFARRGVGLNASAGSVNDPNDQVEDFTPFPQGPNCVLAVNYFKNNDMIRVYPNPANNMVNVRINQFTGKVNFQIVDLNGRVVYDQTDANFNIEKSINLSGFQTGVYILKVIGDNLNYSQKLIKN